MAVDYKKLLDIELLNLYREDYDLFALKILYERYVHYSRMLASDILEESRLDFLADYSELVDQGVFSFQIAMINFKGESNFKAFWRRIAEFAMRNHIYNEIKYYKVINRSQMLEERAGNVSRPLYSNSFSDGIEGTEKMLMEEIISFLSDPINRIKRKDAAMFIDYLDDPSFQRLASKYHYSRKTVSKKINDIRQKIITELLDEKI